MNTSREEPLFALPASRTNRMQESMYPSAERGTELRKRPGKTSESES